MVDCAWNTIRNVIYMTMRLQNKVGINISNVNISGQLVWSNERVEKDLRLLSSIRKQECP
jgi:hypothetical protein